MTESTKLSSKAASAVRQGARSVFRSLALSSLMLRKQLWIWPIIAGLLLACVGFFLRRSVEQAMRDQQSEELSAILSANVAALRMWMNEQVSDAELIAADERLPPLVQSLISTADAGGQVERSLIHSEAQTSLRDRLAPRLTRYHYSGFFLVVPSGLVLASDNDAAVGKPITGFRKDFFDRVMSKGAAVSIPYRSTLMLPDEHGELKPNLPTMFAAAPLTGSDGQVLAALGLRIRADQDFTRIMRETQPGETGETYAFDDKGMLLSESRFDYQLKQLGLLMDHPDASSVLTVELRDPGVDMRYGGRPKLTRAEQPLTEAVASAVSGKSDINVEGYRDYRGAPTVGAWAWLNDLGFGLAVEQDKDEAFAPLIVLRTAFWSMFGLLALASLAIFACTVFVARANREAQLAALEAKQLGQYRLEEKLGEGGMGVVYRGKHAMLHRPTAVKLLAGGKTNPQSFARFEREVQMTSQLNHPNTIAIYDYGRTPEGIFYYAMEYLQGIDLENLVKQFGPQPEGRVIWLLQQACGSLAEAHSIGLIHRDIKPANLMLTERGGIFDFLKVLDFGLVKALDSVTQSSLTAVGNFTGTPLYMSPEAIELPDRVDARSDLYALGAVGYFLLTGTPVFDGQNVIEVLRKQVDDPPEPASQRLGMSVSQDFEALLEKCLAKNPSERPQSAMALMEALVRCSTSGSWTQQQAKAWWEANRPRSSVERSHSDTEARHFAATQEVQHDPRTASTK